MQNSALSYEPSEFALIARLARDIGRPICVLDVETTGLPSDKTPVALVEFGYVVVTSDNEVKVAGTLVNPQVTIPWHATKIHGIQDRDVRDAPHFTAIAPAIAAMFGKFAIVGFNSTAFDVRVLQENLARAGQPCDAPAVQLDIRDVWRTNGHGERGKLADLALHYGVDQVSAHRAVGDALTTARILDAMIYRHGADDVRRSLIETLTVHCAAAEETSQRRAPAAEASVRGAGAAGRRPLQERGGISIKNAIAQHIEHANRISPADYDTIAARCGVKPASVSFQLSEMITNGDVAPEHAADQRVQTLIAVHLAAARRQAGGTSLLKPLKAALDALAGINVDYVQLRIALLAHGQEPSAAHGSRGGPSMR